MGNERDYPVKTAFSRLYTCLRWLTLAVAGWFLVTVPMLPWIGVLLMAAAPTIHYLYPFDQPEVPHHKVRLPRVSFLVMVGMAWVLLTVQGGNHALWLALGNLGAYLLDTYWARERKPAVP